MSAPYRSYSGRIERLTSIGEEASNLQRHIEGDKKLGPRDKGELLKKLARHVERLGAGTGS